MSTMFVVSVAKQLADPAMSVFSILSEAKTFARCEVNETNVAWVDLYECSDVESIEAAIAAVKEGRAISLEPLIPSGRL